MNNKQLRPMPLPEFLHELMLVAKAGQWAKYKQMVKKRREWFENNPGNGDF